ncbi:uncharacterized protein N7469_010640 [Penicillium citrinum]|uniref:Uncharacterized protein n=1 Tax=Penicillium citrinum TaxID=5077 RepID=A0A9W9NN74_PENCI|nr:uncharacterized protein N7469_010640 [Penicillium citrinum]KAJ5221753.1 hypothetical protein N7469_010640 [Penicillium citrinum]
MAYDSKDPDGDSEMASSVDSVHTDFDGIGNGARTPTPIPDLNTVGDFGILGDGVSSQPIAQGSDASIASWKSKRAQEEYQRAMENVIDQDFNLNEFGDPFDERDLEQKQ